MDEELKKAKSEKDVKAAIERAFDKVENEWLEVARTGFNNGYPKTAYVGACALIAIVHDNKLYVANAGDCKGVLLRKKEDSFEAINVSTTFSANKKYEQERLKKQFPGEKDIFICKAGSDRACYVKGGLMPSRAIGDFRLKFREFNFH